MCRSHQNSKIRSTCITRKQFSAQIRDFREATEIVEEGCPSNTVALALGRCGRRYCRSPCSSRITRFLCNGVFMGVKIKHLSRQFIVFFCRSSSNSVLVLSRKFFLRFQSLLKYVVQVLPGYCTVLELLRKDPFTPRSCR